MIFTLSGVCSVTVIFLFFRAWNQDIFFILAKISSAMASDTTAGSLLSDEPLRHLPIWQQIFMASDSRANTNFTSYVSSLAGMCGCFCPGLFLESSKRRVLMKGLDQSTSVRSDCNSGWRVGGRGCTLRWSYFVADEWMRKCDDEDERLGVTVDLEFFVVAAFFSIGARFCFFGGGRWGWGVCVELRRGGIQVWTRPPRS